MADGLRAWDSLFTMKHGVWEVMGSNPNRGNILGEFFILPGYLVRFLCKYVLKKFQILNLFRIIVSVGKHYITDHLRLPH